MYWIIGVIAYILLAPLVGGLLNGLDRKISARMQGRIGPGILQPSACTMTKELTET